jgi:hypothetical protein
MYEQCDLHNAWKNTPELFNANRYTSTQITIVSYANQYNVPQLFRISWNSLKSAQVHMAGHVREAPICINTSTQLEIECEWLRSLQIAHFGVI